MKKLALLIPTLSLALLGFCEARTWTSADGTRTFEGDFVSTADDSVTLRRHYRNQTFKLEHFSQEDQKWVNEQAVLAEASKANEADKARAEDFIRNDFGRALKKLKRLDGKKFTKHKIEVVPEYFILFYATSWCGHCQKAAPQLAKAYTKKFAPNPSIEIIQISLDRETDDALYWANSFAQPWPILLKEDNDREILMEPYGIPGTPTYILVDRYGKEMVRGKSAVFAFAETL